MRPPRRVSTARRVAAAGRARPRRNALFRDLPVSPLHRGRSTLSPQAPRTLSWKLRSPEGSRRGPHPAMNSGRRGPSPKVNGGRRGSRDTRESCRRGLRPTMCSSSQELEEQPRLWQQHLRQQQREPVQHPTPSSPALPIDLAPHGTWASLPTMFKTAVAANWSLTSSSVTEIDAQVSARRCADVATAKQALATAEELALRRETALVEARAAATSAERASEARHRRLHALWRRYSKLGQREPRGSCRDAADVIGHHSSRVGVSAAGHPHSCRDDLGAAGRRFLFLAPFCCVGRPFGSASRAPLQRGHRHGTPPEVWGQILP